MDLSQKRTITFLYPLSIKLGGIQIVLLTLLQFFWIMGAQYDLYCRLYKTIGLPHPFMRLWDSLIATSPIYKAMGL